eukprot:SAG11_NODE_2224_length_3666_cov_2.269975_1_plen_72_part_00
MGTSRPSGPACTIATLSNLWLRVAIMKISEIMQNGGAISFVLRAVRPSGGGETKYYVVPESLRPAAPEGFQ